MAILILLFIFKLEACVSLDVFTKDNGQKFVRDYAAEPGSVESLYPGSFSTYLNRAMNLYYLPYEEAVEGWVRIFSDLEALYDDFNSKTHRTIDFSALKIRLAYFLNPVETKKKKSVSGFRGLFVEALAPLLFSGERIYIAKRSLDLPLKTRHDQEIDLLIQSPNQIRVIELKNKSFDEQKKQSSELLRKIAQQLKVEIPSTYLYLVTLFPPDAINPDVTHSFDEWFSLLRKVNSTSDQSHSIQSHISAIQLD